MLGSTVGFIEKEEKEKLIFTDRKAKERYMKQLEKEMQKAAKELDFERAALLRDEILALKEEENGKG